MDKIILVFYINVGNRDNSEVYEFMDEIKTSLDPKTEDIMRFLIPVRTGETRIKCINPKIVSKEDYEQAKDVLERNQKIVNDFIHSKKL